MPEQTEERPFTADIADLFQREAAVDDAAVPYTMGLRCMRCNVSMVALLPPTTDHDPVFECPKCHAAVEVLFS
jgi:hypothetical protein